MKKNFIVFFLMLLIGMFAYSQGNSSETIFGIKMGTDYETADSVLRSKGFSQYHKVEDKNQRQYLYNGGTFAETKPDIMITISDANKLLIVNVCWPLEYWRYQKQGKQDEVLKQHLRNQDLIKVMERLFKKDNECFELLVRSLNKKYGSNIILPDNISNFYYNVYSDEEISIEYGFSVGDTLPDCIYLLSYQSQSYEAPVSDDL